LEAQNEELELECLRLEHQRREVAAAAQAAAKAAAAELADAERAAREQLTKQKDRSASALAKMRDQVGEWRGRAANLEEQLYEERRKPDECVRSQNAKALAACAAAEARAAAACAESERLAKQKDRSARSLAEMRDEVGEEAEAKHAAVEAKLATSDAALAAYRAFQAKEGGAYKESVRLCYYSLIDRKVPTNQLEAVVTEVLKMVGVEARALPSRGSAQNMRREMGHVADVMWRACCSPRRRMLRAPRTTQQSASAPWPLTSCTSRITTARCEPL
jgi:hypothetical protein